MGRLWERIALRGYAFGMGAAAFAATPLLPLLVRSEKRKLSLPHRLHPSAFAKNEGEKRVWIHALSLGEMLSAVPLVQRVKKTLPGVSIVVSASTQTGFAIACRDLHDVCDAIRYFPLDIPRAVADAVDGIRPDLFVLVETDIWPVFQETLKKRDIPSVWVNARISDKTFAGYQRFSCLMGPAIRQFQAIFPQTEGDMDRLRALSIDSSRLFAAKNLKYDRRTPDPTRDSLTPVRNWQEKDLQKTWVCGSTHPGEEVKILTVFGDLKNAGHKIRLILVPRDPGRGEEILFLIKEAGFSGACLSSGIPEGTDVLVVDAIGLLADLYSLGDIAFVGGSLAPCRGHNPLEAAAAGIPVFFGPNMQDFGEMASHLIKEGAARRVADENTLTAVLGDFLSDEALCEAAGLAGLAVLASGKGATAQAADWIRDTLAGRPALG